MLRYRYEAFVDPPGSAVYPSFTCETPSNILRLWLAETKQNFVLTKTANSSQNVNNTSILCLTVVGVVFIFHKDCISTKSVCV